jgi:DHA1 family tetracycline resistance protein-like MFS transporter
MRRRAALVFVFVTVLLDMLAIGLIAPVLAPLVVTFLGGDTARAAEIYGLAFTLFAAMQFVASPVLGALSDRFGRRPIILLSNVGLGLDYVLMALAPNVTWLLVGRVLAGLTSASITAAGAYVADVTPERERATRRTDSSCCRNRCRPSDAQRFRGAARIPLALWPFSKGAPRCAGWRR